LQNAVQQVLPQYENDSPMHYREITEQALEIDTLSLVPTDQAVPSDAQWQFPIRLDEAI